MNSSPSNQSQPRVGADRDFPDVSDQYIRLKCRPSTLDIYQCRMSIMRSLVRASLAFKGDFLDIGAGFQPYREWLLSDKTQIKKYVALDLTNDDFSPPDVSWDGVSMPFDDASFDSAMATEVFEHCEQPEIVMKEALRVLKPGGTLFFTTPFLWPLHCVPNDHHRFTPYNLTRRLRDCGFTDVSVHATGGWHASLAQMLGLWVRRSPLSGISRRILSILFWPIIAILLRADRPPASMGESDMLPGLWGTARKPN